MRCRSRKETSDWRAEEAVAGDRDTDTHGDATSTPVKLGDVLYAFKKPDRTNYRDEDPVTQAYRMIRDIRESKMKDKGGRYIRPANANIPAYCYSVRAIANGHFLGGLSAQINNQPLPAFVLNAQPPEARESPRRQ